MSLLLEKSVLLFSQRAAVCLTENRLINVSFILITYCQYSTELLDCYSLELYRHMLPEASLQSITTSSPQTLHAPSHHINRHHNAILQPPPLVQMQRNPIHQHHRRGTPQTPCHWQNPHRPQRQRRVDPRANESVYGILRRCIPGAKGARYQGGNSTVTASEIIGLYNDVVSREGLRCWIEYENGYGFFLE